MDEVVREGDRDSAEISFVRIEMFVMTARRQIWSIRKISLDVGFGSGRKVEISYLDIFFPKQPMLMIII